MGWGSGNLGGAGGVGLNFKVVQYATTPTGTAAENTIGVVTDTAITSWVMQAEQPTGTAGLVWIKVAAASDVAFYADKKQRVKLYPKSVRQYVDGAWTRKEAYIYQNSAWVEFSSARIYIYNNGTDEQAYTITTNGTGAYKKNSASITMKSGTSTSGSESGAYLVTDTAISVADFASLSARVNVTAVNGGVCSLSLRDADNTDNILASVKTSGTGEQTISLSLDGVSDGLYRVRFIVFNNRTPGRYVNVDLYELYFE